MRLYVQLLIMIRLHAINVMTNNSYVFGYFITMHNVYKHTEFDVW